MKTKILAALLSMSIISGTILTGCQATVRDYGGSMTLKLEPNEKLEMITWKEDSLWYLTRPMREDEFPESHTFQQQKTTGLFEGTVTVIESSELKDSH